MVLDAEAVRIISQAHLFDGAVAFATTPQLEAVAKTVERLMMGAVDAGKRARFRLALSA